MISTDIPSYRCGPARIVTARSYLIDRFVPECEVIALPPKTVTGGQMTYALGPLEATLPKPSGLIRRMAEKRREKKEIRDTILIDLRRKTPENFAHFLNNHLPLSFHLRAELGVAWEEMTALTPAKTPGYISATAALFGLRILATDDDVTGTGISYDLTPWTAQRPVRAGWVRNQIAQAALAALPAATTPLPPKVFLSRRDTRTLSNEAEVEAALQARGFVKLYPEDLSVADQMRLFQQATDIVAIHSASLAPLLYAPANGARRQVIELMPCGHMTDVYRVMADQTGWRWIGVRGKIAPEHVHPAYKFAEEFKAFSLDPFEIDMASLDMAFDLAEQDVL